MTNILVLGNAPLTCDRSAEIDSFDLVTRFNLPQGIGEFSGNKFDMWVLCNGGSGMRRARSKDILNASYKKIPSTLWFPRTTDIHQRWNSLHPNLLNPIVLDKEYSREIIQENQLDQANTLHLGSKNYWKCIQKLSQITPSFAMPSSGFITIHYIISQLKHLRLTCMGFNFEGWEGHPWKAEKQLITQWANEKKLIIA